MPNPAKTLALPGTAIHERALAAGYVSTARPAPTSFTGVLWVILPEHSTEAPIPCQWGAEHGTSLPRQGARVIVGFPGGDHDVPVVLWWEGAQAGIEKGVVLPAEPYDGQEYDYVADLADGVTWRFRYNAASASAHKWEFRGGAPLFSSVGEATPFTVAKALEWLLPLANAEVVAPLAGDYEASYSISILPQGTGGFIYTEIEPAISVGVTQCLNYSSGTQPVVGVGAGVLKGVSPGAPLRVWFNPPVTSGTPWRFLSTHILVRPVRVG